MKLVKGLVAAFVLFAAAAAAPVQAQQQAEWAKGDMAIGKPDAPVTVIEYASMSCPHCAAFHEEVFDQLKAEYIDTGKVRWLFREFPHNNPGYPPAMVARCAPEGRFFEIVDAYFTQQEEWLSSPDIMQAIREIALDNGFTEESFDACVSNQALFEALKEGRDRGAAFGVQGTPTFFINGEKFQNAPSFANLQQEIEAAL